jgi:diaminopimelate epimerase
MLFTKMQGVGNDFVVLEDSFYSGEEAADLARLLCTRHFGIGADGLLLIGHGSADTDFSFRMYNPDGSEDMCGNGLRCACLWSHSRSRIKTGAVKVLTKDGIHSCNLLRSDGHRATVQVNMGIPRFEAQHIPMLGVPTETSIAREFTVLGKPFLATVVNTGSTHTVIFLDESVSDGDFFAYSPHFERLPIFPERTSVLWAYQTGSDRFFTRIWERGAGETLGCGTGACAVGVAAVVNHRALLDQDIIVESKGGALEIKWREDISMTGPAELVFEGSWPRN